MYTYNSYGQKCPPPLATIEADTTLFLVDPPIASIGSTRRTLNGYWGLLIQPKTNNLVLGSAMLIFSLLCNAIRFYICFMLC
jgi:hypothetical protein